MKRAVRFLIVAAALVFAATPASADTTCGVGSTCIITLTQTNVTQLAGYIGVTVTIDNTGANTILSFQVTTVPNGFTALGIDMAGWNTTSGYFPTTLPSGWSTPGNNPNGQMDGFGNFAFAPQNGGATAGISSPLSFTLNGLVTTFSSNTGGNEFAVHVRLNNSCSGYVGGQVGTTSVSSDPNCTVVPEPGTLALFGSGLLGLAGVLRRRLLS